VKKPPEHWQELPSVNWPPGSDHVAARSWRHKVINMTVLRSRTKMRDGRSFFHISLARPDRMPTWEEVSKVKNEFLGEETPAYHVIPAKKDYVNAHNYCLHIWCPIKGEAPANLQDIEIEAGE
jgi:hypothetical protein